MEGFRVTEAASGRGEIRTASLLVMDARSGSFGSRIRARGLDDLEILGRGPGGAKVPFLDGLADEGSGESCGEAVGEEEVDGL